MQDYGAMIRSTFELGSVRDAEVLFEACIKNAFPTFHFRRLELIRFMRELLPCCDKRHKSFIGMSCEPYEDMPEIAESHVLII